MFIKLLIRLKCAVIMGDDFIFVLIPAANRFYSGVSLQNHSIAQHAKHLQGQALYLFLDAITM